MKPVRVLWTLSLCALWGGACSNADDADTVATDGGSIGTGGVQSGGGGGGGAGNHGVGGATHAGSGGAPHMTGSGGAVAGNAGHGGSGSSSTDAGSMLEASASIDAGPRPPSGHSAGCGKQHPAQDSADDFTKHDVAVTGVDPAFIQAHPANAGSWTDRTYYVRLPADYDASKAYPLTIGGGGCGNTDGTSGSGGGLSALPNGQKLAIQVGLNYVYPENAGACFADDYVNTPDLPYFDAVLADLEANYCVERGQVFVDGFSSGAWETYLLGCARAGTVRGSGTAAGGLRMTRPACSEFPVAAILVAGRDDMENPIGPLEPPGKNDSLGSAPARDDILSRNGCVGTDTQPWDAAYPKCVKYSGCPVAYPVVWCAINAGHGDGGDISRNGFWKFWSSLPAP